LLRLGIHIGKPASASSWWAIASRLSDVAHLGLSGLLHGADDHLPGAIGISGAGSRPRRIVHFNVPAPPTAEWTGQQLREAFPFDQIPRYLLRDGDGIFGREFRRDVAAIGI
jgi:hypothetical protein